MDSTEFQRWLARIDELTPSQCQRAIDTLYPADEGDTPS